MKILKNILIIIVVLAMLLFVLIRVPINCQFDEKYNVIIYDTNSNDIIQNMEVHIIGEYKHYLFNINSHCRFVGDLVVNEGYEDEKCYTCVIADLYKGNGIIRYFEESGDMNIIGCFFETRNPIKKGKIILSNICEDYYAVYESR